VKLKLTLRRPGGRPDVDLLVAVEPTTTVGALAGYLSDADPSDAHSVGQDKHWTLSQAGRLLSERTPVSESGLRSGVVVSLEAAGSGGEPASAGAPAAVVRVVAGPDEGRDFAVPVGTSVIGRDRGCEVRLTDQAVSRQHAKLLVTDVAEVVDLGSANGLQVGDEFADRVVLRPGDTVKLGDTVVSVNVLAPLGGSGVQPTNISFNRPPRVDRRYVGVEFRTPEPPDAPRTQRFPLITLFTPAIMGAVIYFSTHNVASLLFVAMTPLMMIGNLVEQRMTAGRTYSQALEQFRADIADLTQEITSAAEEERSRRCEENPPSSECVAAVRGFSSLMWSKRPDLDGFLELRLGLGRQPSRNRIEIPDGKQNNRALWRELKDVVEPFESVDDVPVVARLQAPGAIGVGGPREAALGSARSLLLQVGCLHSPAEVIIAVCASSPTADDWEWLKWLPHCESPQSPLKVSHLASTVSACAALVNDIHRVLEERLGAGGKDGVIPGPAVVLVVDNDSPVDRPFVVELATHGSSVGVHVLWVAPDVQLLPAVCDTFLDVSSRAGGGSVGFVHAGETVQPVTADVATAELALATARALSPVVDVSAADDEAGDLPRTVSFLSLVGTELATSPEAVIERWNESRSIVTSPLAVPSDIRRPGSLRAVVGQSAGGPHILDLRTHGPHALVGGTTGAGKSELLQSWILAMAAAHSPQRVTFLLVDYKGGSAFSECVRLPHTVGLVTDLSPHLVRRALVSLAAELRYREQVLHRKGAKDLPELERSRDPDAPPSLVIVVDEFAALVQEVPDFVDGVVNVAQRGRSLGLHLILATQRPAGVIKDNLRANTNLRLALRMADEADSTDVLGSPQAAAFDPTIPGRAVSRTGPSQLVPFQAGYAGGWTEDLPPEAGIHVESFGLGPGQVWEVARSVNPSDHQLGPTDIQRVVANIRTANDRAELAPPRIPWLAELASVYDLAKLPTRRRDDTLVFGVMDDPERQEQPTVAFYPDRDGNLAVIGTGGSGKSTLLRTLAVAAGLTVRGGRCIVYGIDFGARGLHVLEELPHVGSIVGGGDHERVGRLLDMLRTTIDERAARYSKVSAGTITDYRRLAGDKDEPRILLLLDGMGAMRSAFEGTEHNRLFERFIGIASDGRPVGVHVLISADRMGALPTTLASQVQRRVVLRLADSADYGLMGLANDVIDSKSPAGRGLLDDAEIQVAVLGGSADVLAQSRAIEKFAASMVAAGIPEAPKIERLSDWVDMADLPVEIGGRPVFGVSGVTLEPATFEPAGVYLVAGPPVSGRTTALKTIVSALRRWSPNVRLFYFGNARSTLATWNGWERSALSEDDSSRLASDISGFLGESSSGPRGIVVLESVPEMVNSAADFALQEMVKKVVAAGHMVVAEGEISGLASSYPLLTALRNGRCGIVLQPEQLDASILRTQFPRLRKADFPPGRGLFVPRGGQPELVQIALPQASDWADLPIVSSVTTC
jgi:S-DNA-T family DNA segregation ATPase FtsK/SpoIIIE